MYQKITTKCYSQFVHYFIQIRGGVFIFTIFTLSFNFLSAQFVTGTVYNACTGLPIANHEVEFSNNLGAWTTITDQFGEYSIFLNYSGNDYTGSTFGTKEKITIINQPFINLNNRNFYVIPIMPNTLEIVTCTRSREPICNEIPDIHCKVTVDLHKELSIDSSNPTKIGCGDWIIPIDVESNGIYAFKVEIYGGTNFQSLVGDTDWQCSLVRPSPCEHGGKLLLSIQNILNTMQEGIYKIKFIAGCCVSVINEIDNLEAYIHWIPNIEAVNVDFRFTASSQVETTNDDQILDGKLDACYSEIPGAMLGGISGGIAFDALSANNAIEWSKIVIREVDCLEGTPGTIIYENTWQNIEGNQVNPFSFAEVRDPINPNQPYFLLGANVNGKCFSLTFSALNPCDESSLTQYFTVPEELIFWKPEMPDSGVHEINVSPSLYPNPVQSTLNVVLNNINENLSEFSIMDINGRVSFYETISSGTNHLTVPVDSWNNGVYIWLYITQNEVFKGVFVKQ